MGSGSGVIRQGEIHWADSGDSAARSGPGYVRPVLVLQNDVFNASRIRTVVVCALTTNLRRGTDPGNVMLVPGEGGVPEQSVVNVSQLVTLDKRELRHRAGKLAPERMQEVLEGIDLLLKPRSIG